MFRVQIFLLVIGTTLVNACGCVDFIEATTAVGIMNANYKTADTALSNSLASLGVSIKDGYIAMNNGALDMERLVRLKKEQALVLRDIAFLTDQSASLASTGNNLLGKSAEADLLKAEKTSVLKSTTLNKKSMMEGR